MHFDSLPTWSTHEFQMPLHFSCPAPVVTAKVPRVDSLTDAACVIEIP
jgi:hypothetical protein